MDYPRGLDADSWWEYHSPIFVREHNSQKAAKFVDGWVSRIYTFTPNSPAIDIQLSAAEYQQRGQWGGHEDFGPAFYERGYPKGAADGESESSPSVVWWPKVRDK
jgi:hypothetical protein